MSSLTLQHDNRAELLGEDDPEFGFEMVKRMAAVVVRRLEASQRYLRHPALLSPE